MKKQIITLLVFHYTLGVLSFGFSMIYNVFTLFNLDGVLLIKYPGLLFELFLLAVVFYRKNKFWAWIYGVLKLIIGLIVLISLFGFLNKEVRLITLLICLLFGLSSTLIPIISFKYRELLFR